MNTTRHLLGQLAEDKTAPPQLRADLTSALEVWDLLIEADQSAAQYRRQTREVAVEARRREPARLVDCAGTGDLDYLDVLADVIALEVTADQAEERARMIRRALHLAEARAQSNPIRTHRADVLRWVASTRVETPWEEPVAPHVSHAWNRITAFYRWQYPTVAREFHPRRLIVDTQYPLSRLIWQAIHEDRVQYQDGENVTTALVLAYWPEYATPSQ